MFKAIEIISTNLYDNQNDQFIKYFINVPTISMLPGGYIFKKAIQQADVTTLHYGIFDYKQQTLLAYTTIILNGTFGEIYNPFIMQAFTGQGLLSYMNYYAIFKDGIKLMGTVTGSGNIRALWEILYKRRLFKINVLNLNTNIAGEWDGQSDSIFNIGDLSNIRLVAELYSDIDCNSEKITNFRSVRRSLGMDDLGKYGPGTSSEGYWNP